MTLKTSYDDIKALAAKIKSLGAKNVIITGIERGNTLYNCILDDTGYSERAASLLPYRMHGTGDCSQRARRRDFDRA